MIAKVFGMRLLKIYIFIGALLGCSNLKQNFIKTGHVQVNGGMQEKAQWSSPLIFNRYSWFHELTLMYEVLIADLDLKSPFSNWLSKAESRAIKGCSQFKLVMIYTLDPAKISKRVMQSSIEKNGYSLVSINHFKDSLMLHPDVENLSLQLYDLYGYCKKVPGKGSQIFVNVPSYSEVLIE